MDPLLFNRNKTQTVKNITSHSIAPLDRLQGLKREAQTERSRKLISDLFNPPMIVRCVKAVPEKNIAKFTADKYPDLDRLSGLKNEAAGERALQEVSIIKGANKALKAGQADEAEDILGRKLTQEEIMNGCIGPANINQIYHDYIHSKTIGDLMTQVQGFLGPKAKKEIKHLDLFDDLLSEERERIFNLTNDPSIAKKERQDMLLKFIHEKQMEMYGSIDAIRAGDAENLASYYNNNVEDKEEYRKEITGHVKDQYEFDRQGYDVDEDVIMEIEDIMTSKKDVKAKQNLILKALVEAHPEREKEIKNLKRKGVTNQSLQKLLMEILSPNRVYERNKRIATTFSPAHVRVKREQGYLNPGSSSQLERIKIKEEPAEVDSDYPPLSGFYSSSSSSHPMGYGLGLPKKKAMRDDYRQDKPFGRYEVDMKSLNNNVLALRFSHNKHALSNYPKMEISDNLKDVVRSMMTDMNFDLDKLNDVELGFVNNLIKNSKINVSLPKTFSKVVLKKKHPSVSQVGTPKSKMINEFKILTGELLANNDSTEIKFKLKALAQKMVNCGLLTSMQCSNVLREFC
jgi:hypothetical protein